MNRRILPLIIAAACINAEDAVPPPPAAAPEPAKPAAAPEPAKPAETAPAATETAPAKPGLTATLEGAPVAGPATASTSLQQARGVRVAKVANAAPWEATVRLAGGYDSNALLESNPDKTSSSTAVYTGDAGLFWRPVADDRDYLKAGVVAGYDSRPNLDDLDTSRLGVSAAGAMQRDAIAWGGSLIANRYWVGSEGAAAELRGGGSMAWLRRDSADLLSIEAAAIHYDAVGDRPNALPSLSGLGTSDARSGVLAAGGYRHWWILSAQHRIEGGIRAGRYDAEIDTETYSLVQPFVATRLRPGLWDLQARASIDWRAYAGSVPGHDPERSTTLTALASANRRIERVRGLSAGLFGAVTTRDSSLTDRGYDRWQAGLQLSWTYTPEE